VVPVDGQMPQSVIRLVVRQMILRVVPEAAEVHLRAIPILGADVQRLVEVVHNPMTVVIPGVVVASVDQIGARVLPPPLREQAHTIVALLPLLKLALEQLPQPSMMPPMLLTAMHLAQHQ
jgi:hypothetical protein